MIGSLRGRLLHRGAGEVLVEVGGLGYQVVVAPTTAVALGDVGDEAFVWVHHHVREDAETLYGFATRDERVTFEALLGAHGVGPAMALAILSVHGPPALVRILADDDVAALCLVPGVGKKTAARLLVELKSRLDVPDTGAGVSAAAVGGSVVVAGERTAVTDVREALAGLGYSADEIRVATADMVATADGTGGGSSGGGGDDGDASALLRAALQRLAAAR
jgi:holliday junction DNA helicase RuvA